MRLRGMTHVSQKFRLLKRVPHSQWFFSFNFCVSTPTFLRSQCESHYVITHSSKHTLDFLVNWTLLEFTIRICFVRLFWLARTWKETFNEQRQSFNRKKFKECALSLAGLMELRWSFLEFDLTTNQTFEPTESVSKHHPADTLLSSNERFGRSCSIQ